MSFWDFVNEVKANATGSMEINVGFGVIPDNTRALAQITDAKWKKFYQAEEEYLSVTWEILEPESLRGMRTEIKHKIKDLEPSVVNSKGKDKAETALRNALTLFASIDANAGGRIIKFLSEKHQWPSEDQINMALREKPMLILFGEWLQANGNRGNTVRGVAPKGTKSMIVGDSSKVKPMSDNGGAQSGSFAAQDAWGAPAAKSQTAPNAASDDEIPW